VTRFWERVLKWSSWVAWMVCASAGLLLLLEGAVRLLFPHVNVQSTSRNLFLPGKYGPSHGLRPGGSGTSFGVPVSIDEDGFRAPAVPSGHRPSATILMLGDSVTFGVGVAEPETFVGRLQAARPDLRIINTAAPLYNMEDYRNLLERLPLESWGVRHAYLFYNLNDVFGRSTLVADVAEEASWDAVRRGATWSQRAIVGQSKLYVLLKSLRQGDISLAYFRRELLEYEPDSPRFTTLSLLEETQTAAARRGIGLRVVLLPCEPQLRDPPLPDGWKPQRLLSGFLAERGIGYLDLASAFSTDHGASRSLFLYADHMHFSAAGHAVAFEAILDDLQRTLAEPRAVDAPQRAATR
jgi:hypothetical protein